MSQILDFDAIIGSAYPADPETSPFLLPDDLADLGTQKLQRLCNRAFQELDTENPAYGTQENYQMIVDELELRAARERTVPSPARATVRDHITETRFEIYVGGEVAGALDYRMRGQQLWILRTAVTDKYEGTDFADVLLETALHSAHRRRIAVVPLCPLARKYLTAHPQYLPLVPETHSYTLLAG